MIKWQAVCKNELKTAKASFSTIFARNIENQIYSLSAEIPELLGARVLTSIKDGGIVELEVVPSVSSSAPRTTSLRSSFPYAPEKAEDDSTQKLKEKLAPFVKDCIRNSLKSGGLL